MPLLAVRAAFLHFSSMIPHIRRPALQTIVCFIAALILLASAQPAAANAPPGVKLRAGVHARFDRLVFDWPRRVDYRIERVHNQVAVRFSAPAQFAYAPAALRRLTRASGFGQSSGADDCSLNFFVEANAVIADSRQGTLVIVDILAPASIKQAVKPPVPAATQPRQDGKRKPVFADAVTPVIAPVPPARIAFLTLPTLLATVADAQEVKLPPPPMTAPSDAQEPSSVSRLTLPGSGQPPMPVLQLNPGMPLALAAYARGGYGYIIFERKLTLDPRQLIAGQNAQLTLQPLSLPQATGFRFALPPHTDLRVNRNGNTWIIYLAAEKRRVPVTMSFMAEPDYALGPRLLLPVVNPPEVIRFQDPVIGDTLSIVPMLRPGDAMTTPRHYADLTMLVSAQGLAILHHNDRLAVRRVANGIEIAAGNGLRLSPSHDTGVTEKSESVRAGKKNLLFDFQHWRGLKSEDFTAARQRLLQNVVNVPPQERDRVRIELARLYFAYGFGAEAWALLDEIGRRLPDLFARPEFRALHGAARILAGDAEGGLADLAMPELEEAADRPLWEALALAVKRDYAAAAAKFETAVELIDDLPEPLFTRFAVMALETMIAAQQSGTADQWLDHWRAGKERKSFLSASAVTYLHGVILYAAGNVELAVKEWQRAAAGKDRLYRTRAELALIDVDVVKGKLTAAAAAQRLEGMRFVWRGDALEWEILHRLALYDFQAKKFHDGFVNFGRAEKRFADTPGHADFKQTVREKFRDIFVTDLGADLTPLEALALYQDYRSLITDAADARPIIRALTERLVAVDLLEQAAQLLEDLLPVATGADRAQLGARLAGIYLLDHQPQKSLAALAASQTEGLGERLIQERQLLQTRALLETGQPDAARALLANRADAPAQLLLGDIAWQAGQWPEAAAAFSRALGAPAATEAKLTGDRAALAIKIATALALSGDQSGLDRLARDFGPAMQGSAQHEIFALLTRPQDSANIRDIANAAQQAGDVDLFRKFLDRYRGADGEGQAADGGELKTAKKK